MTIGIPKGDESLDLCRRLVLCSFQPFLDQGLLLRSSASSFLCRVLVRVFYKYMLPMEQIFFFF